MQESESLESARAAYEAAIRELAAARWALRESEDGAGAAHARVRRSEERVTATAATLASLARRRG